MDKETYEAMRELTEEIVELQAAIHNIYALLETFLWYNVKNALTILFQIAKFAKKSDGSITSEWKVKKNELHIMVVCNIWISLWDLRQGGRRMNIRRMSSNYCRICFALGGNCRCFPWTWSTDLLIHNFIVPAVLKFIPLSFSQRASLPANPSGNLDNGWDATSISTIGIQRCPTWRVRSFWKMVPNRRM